MVTMVAVHPFYVNDAQWLEVVSNNSKINLQLVGKKKRVVIAPKRTLSSNK